MGVTLRIGLKRLTTGFVVGFSVRVDEPLFPQQHRIS
jgi:hypothetical protein